MVQEQTAAFEASFLKEMDALQDQCDRLAVSLAQSPRLQSRLSQAVQSALEIERTAKTSAQLKLRQLTEAHDYLKRYTSSHLPSLCHASLCHAYLCHASLYYASPASIRASCAHLVRSPVKSGVPAPLLPKTSGRRYVCDSWKMTSA